MGKFGMSAHALCTPAFAAHVARLAVRSLHTELALYPKPGLVSMVNSGSHRDMDVVTFMRSLFALRHYFRAITRAGADDPGFAALRTLGQGAEQKMLAATGGVNTDRGTIFSLGLFCALCFAMMSGAASANMVSFWPLAA
jgi:triphosphoribosyl-dephospho-CoA synthase